VLKSTNFALKRRELLAEVLKEVPYKGWSEDAVKAAAKHIDKEPAYFNLYFPDLIQDMVDLFIEDFNAEYKEILKEQDFSNLKIREKIANCIMLRLKQFDGKKLLIRKTIDFFALPQHLPQCQKRVWEVCNMMWRKAGDKSSDYNYYTKRTLLSGVYISSLLFYLEDSSKNHAETRGFVDRRIEDVLKIGNIKQIKGTFTSSMRQIPFLRVFCVNGFFKG
jgi:ubiquinone biosynthesis protein COQ9